MNIETYGNDIKDKFIIIWGNVNGNNGYGQYTRGVAKCFIQLYGQNNTIMILDTNMPNYDFTSTEKYSKLPQYITNDRKVLTDNFIDIFVQVTPPQSFQPKGLYNIGITALAQSDKINPKIIQKINTMDHVFVMSKFNIHTINNSQTQKIKLTTNVSILPQPLQQLKSFVKSEQIIKNINNISQKDCFVFTGTWLPGGMGQDRKNVALLINFWARLSKLSEQFKKNNALILKISQGNDSILQKYQIMNKITELFNMAGFQNQKDSNVYLYFGDMTDSELYTIYSHPKMKGFISFTHGESFGIPILEFIIYSGGKSVLVPKWSGYLDYLLNQNNTYFNGTLIAVPKGLTHGGWGEFFIEDSKWFQIDVQNTKQKILRYIKQPKLISNTQKMFVLKKSGIDYCKNIINQILIENID